MSIKIVQILFLIIYVNNSLSLLPHDSQKFQSVPDIIRSNGYVVEIHKVVTEDGYILELHRIAPKRSNSIQNAPVVFMHHCLLCSSYEFVINSPNTSLGYILADAGYDVWLANSRGNYYSRNHTTLSPTQKQFWDFSFDEIALKDLPAGIDHALNIAGQKKLNYVGYSMGCAVALALLSDKPEYNDKVKLLILAAPPPYVEHSRGPLINIAEGILMKVYRILGIYEVLPGSLLFDAFTSLVCSEPIGPVCEVALEQLTGVKTKYIKRGLLPTIISHTPAGTSINNIAHFAQGAASGAFRKFDLGSSRNLITYGTKIPPDYELKNVRVPVAVFSSQDDWFAVPEDVQRMISELPNVIFHKKITGKEFSHLDFFWMERAEALIYQDILKLLRNN